MHLRTLITPLALGAWLLTAGCSFHASVGSRTSRDAYDNQNQPSQSRTRVRTVSSTRTRRPRVTRADRSRTTTTQRTTKVVRTPTRSTGQAKPVATVRENPNNVARNEKALGTSTPATSPEHAQQLKDAEAALAKVRAQQAAADEAAKKRLQEQERELAAALQTARDAEAAAARDMARIRAEHEAEMQRIRQEHELSLKKLEEEESEAGDPNDPERAAMRRMVNIKNKQFEEARQARRKELEEKLQSEQQSANSKRSSGEASVHADLGKAHNSLAEAMRNAMKK